MMPQVALALLPYILSLGISLGIFLLLSKHRDNLGAKSYSVALLIQIGTIVCYIFELLATDLLWNIFWDDCQWVGLLGYSSAMFISLFEFTGRPFYKFRKIIFASIGINALVLILLLIFSHSPLSRYDIVLINNDLFTILTYNFGLLTWVAVVVIYVNTLILVGVLVQKIIKEKRSLYRRQTAILLLGFLLPVLVSFLGSAGVTINYQRDITPLSFGFSNIFVVWGVWRLQIFNVKPIAQSLIFENINVGVCVFDKQLQLVDLNPAMANNLSNLPNNSSNTLGTQASSIFHKCPNVLELIASDNSHEIEATIMGNGSEKIYLVRKIQLQDNFASKLGFFLVFDDITDKKRTAQIILDAKDQLEAAFQKKN